MPVGADGLVFLPYLQGERTPSLPNGCGVLHGMNTANTTPAHVARAVIEGVTLGMAYGLRRMEELGVKPETIRLTGGGSNSAVWRRICADIFGYPVVTLKSSEGGALGAAIQALATAGGESAADLSSRLVRVDEEARVDPRGDFDYGRVLERQNHLRSALFMHPNLEIGKCAGRGTTHAGGGS